MRETAEQVAKKTPRKINKLSQVTKIREYKRKLFMERKYTEFISAAKEIRKITRKDRESSTKSKMKN